jgi:hypothetical protein
LNTEFRKRTEESSMQPISVVIVYNTVFTWDTKTHKTMLEPIVEMYGCQTWSVTDGITYLNSWERNTLRKVCGPVTEWEVWKMRTNPELKELYKTSDLAANIRRMLMWFRYVITMEQSRRLRNLSNQATRMKENVQP